jgi:hypothetical protein
MNIYRKNLIFSLLESYWLCPLVEVKLHRFVGVVAIWSVVSYETFSTFLVVGFSFFGRASLVKYPGALHVRRYLTYRAR